MKNTQVTLVCAICGVEFKRKKSHVRESNTCSKPCGDKQKAQRAYQRMCDTVGEDFKTWLYREYITNLKSTRQIAEVAYGSSKNNSCIQRWLISCGIEARRGSEAVKTQWINNEERRAISSRTMKKTMTPKLRQKITETLRTPECRARSSQSKIGEKNPMYGVTGPNNPNWNPERTHEQRAQERKTGKDKAWRLAVFERDKFTCQFCGDARGGNLVAHHINSYSKHKELRHDPSNGITLCEDCHKDYHSAYGWKNATAEKFNLFMQKTMIA